MRITLFCSVITKVHVLSLETPVLGEMGTPPRVMRKLPETRAGFSAPENSVKGTVMQPAT